MLEWFFIGLQKMDIVAYARITGTAVYLLVIILIVKVRDDTVLTGIAWTIGGIVTALFFTYSFKQSGYTFHFERSKKYFWKTLKESFPLGIASYISQFLIAFPVIYVAYIAGNSEAGIFSAALKMIGLFLMFDRIFVTLFLPKITNVISTRESSLEEIFNVVLKIIVLFVLIISIFLFLFSGLIITKAFGADYNEAIFIFRLLLVYFILTIIDSVFANTLIGLMKEKVYTLSLFIAAIFFMIMTFILTPFFNEYGVIYSFIATNFISLSYMIYKLKNEIKIKLTRYILLPLIFSSLFYILLIMFPLTLYIQAIIIIVVFIPVLILITRFNKSDINFIKRIFI
jgi:PST family polysaccharide transporter